MIKEREKTVAFIVMMLVIIQLLLGGTKWVFSLFINQTLFGRKMTTMVSMAVLSVLFILFSRLQKAQLSVFPKPFNKFYIISTCVAAGLMAFAPENFIRGITSVLCIIYGSIVTPVFEELIFRGYIWNKLNSVFLKEKNVFISSAVLFSLWHLGYMVPNIISGNWFAVITKLLAGLCYGIVLGLIRLKTKNCYSTILMHGVLNLFMA